MDESFNILLERAKPLVKISKAWDIVPCKFGLMSVFIAGECKDTGDPLYGAKHLTSFEDLLLDVFLEVEAIVRASFRNANYSDDDLLGTFVTFATHYIKDLPQEDFAKFVLKDYILRELLGL